MRKPENPPDSRSLPPGFAEAMTNPRYLEVARRVEAHYRSWRRVKFMARAEGLSPEVLWALVKFSRVASYRALPLQGDNGVSLKFNVPDLVQEELMHIDQQLAGRIISSDDQPISQAHQDRFVISALREEAIASSMLEGAQTTHDDAKRMLSSGRKPRTRGEQMVANNYEAMTFIRENRRTAMSPEFLLRVQSILTEGTLDHEHEVGRFRTNTDYVRITDPENNVLHVPPASAELPHRLEALCAFANGESGDGFIHPVIRASVVHFQIGFDHPFCDGNGRTARTMFYWAMLRAGYWLFEYLPISRLIYAGPSQYAMAYLSTETDDFDVTYFLAYKAKIIGRARKDLSQYIDRKHREMSAARKVFESDHRLNHRQRDIILRMVRTPHLSLSIQDHQSRYGAAYGTARSDLLDLVEWNYLFKSQEGNRFIFIRGPKLEAPDVS